MPSFNTMSVAVSTSITVPPACPGTAIATKELREMPTRVPRRRHADIAKPTNACSSKAVGTGLKRWRLHARNLQHLTKPSAAAVVKPSLCAGSIALQRVAQRPHGYFLLQEHALASAIQ